MKYLHTCDLPAIRAVRYFFTRLKIIKDNWTRTTTPVLCISEKWDSYSTSTRQRVPKDMPFVSYLESFRVLIQIMWQQQQQQWPQATRQPLHPTHSGSLDKSVLENPADCSRCFSVPHLKHHTEVLMTKNLSPEAFVEHEKLSETSPK